MATTARVLQIILTIAATAIGLPVASVAGVFSGVAAVTPGQDGAFAPAMNPASVTGAGARVTAGPALFDRQRETSVEAAGLSVPDLGNGVILPGFDGDALNSTTLFLVPDFGIAWDRGDGLTLGLGVVADGSADSQFPLDSFAPSAGTGGAQTSPGWDAGRAGLFRGAAPASGVDLTRFLITPIIAIRLNPHHSIGFSPVVGYQSPGTQNGNTSGGGSGVSADPASVGDDDAWGYGARIGYLGRFGRVSLGATATSEMDMGAVDARRDITVFSLGVDYAYNARWRFRAGLHYLRSPCDVEAGASTDDRATAADRQLTAGITYSSKSDRELIVTFRQALDDGAHWSRPDSPIPGTGRSDSDRLRHNAIHASYAWKF
jgi:long-subunit fatty acid transport protein